MTPADSEDAEPAEIAQDQAQEFRPTDGARGLQGFDQPAYPACGADRLRSELERGRGEVILFW